jgi:hypothetical protein
MANDEQITTRIEFAKFILEHNQGLIDLADTKASIILGIDGFVLLFLFNSVHLGAPALKVVASLLLISSAVTAFITINPTTSKSSPPTHIFFGHITKKDRDAYVSDFRAINTDDILKDVTNNIYSLAIIEKAKLHWLKISLSLLILAFIPFLLMIA